MEAVNRLNTHGQWHYLLVEDPGQMGIQINSYFDTQWEPGPFELS